ncbi:general odorant-binding protein 57e [Drosophila rhopaloa]|uniref:General odorant-binding protein 57e-like n=1 Tax=Drosophila rhopaloa TaxID=1041015 RepID=A0A6P4FGA5_DRORH|nr:general odorant-binding protein 57e [Drosophila rhopaloa]
MLNREALYLFLMFLCRTVHSNSAVYNPCIRQMELTKDEASQVLEKWPDNGALVDREFKCFLTCVLLDLGLISKHGVVQIGEYLRSGVVDWKWVATDLVVCRAEYEDEKDLCELSFGLFNCFREVKLAAERKASK